MEYLIYAALFVGGWILSKIDTKARLKSILVKQTTSMLEETFMAGAKEGHSMAQRQFNDHIRGVMEQRGIDPDNLPTNTNDQSLGFAIPNTNEGKN